MTDPTRVPGMTPEEIEQAFSETVGPLTFDEQPYDIKEQLVSDPTKSLPWRVVRYDGPEPFWDVVDSCGFILLHGIRDEALARTVAAVLPALVELGSERTGGGTAGYLVACEWRDKCKAMEVERDQLKVELSLIDKALEEHKTPAKHFKTGSPLNRAERVYWGLAFTFIGEMDAEITKLRALAGELAAALKPFAEYGETLVHAPREDYPMNDAGSREGRGDIPTVGDCRRAAELLARAAAILTQGEQP